MQKSIFACEIWFYIHHGGILSLASQYVLDMDQVIENNICLTELLIVWCI